eukprot:909095-Rhodomonas_salina.1
MFQHPLTAFRGPRLGPRRLAPHRKTCSRPRVDLWPAPPLLVAANAICASVFGGCCEGRECRYGAQHIQKVAAREKITSPRATNHARAVAAAVFVGVAQMESLLHFIE